MYYWVNQGKTYKEEYKGGYMWAPKKDKRGNTPYHWATMNNLNINDVVFNYAKGYLVGYCIITSTPYESPIPSEFNVDVEWEEDGVMVDADYVSFKEKIGLLDFYNKCSSLLPDKYSPISSQNEIRANQGYLYELNNELGESILNIANEEILISNIHVIEKEFKELENTSKQSLVNTRIGQGEFRRRILYRWKNKCAVSGCNLTSILIASHIVPWREATNKERTDINNGILLAPNFDALFDKHLISFSSNGDIILSPTLNKQDLISLGITGKERIQGLTDGNKKYLKIHNSRLI